MKSTLLWGAAGCLVVACGGGQKKGTTPEGHIKQQQQAQTQSPGDEISAEEANADRIGGGGDDQGGPAVPVPGSGGAAAAAPASPGAPPPQTGPQPTGIVKSAKSLVRRGQYEQAIAEARRALRRNEKYVPAMVVMARAYFHLGKHEFAESMCEQTALKLNPNSGACYNLLGHIALKQEDEGRALKNFEKATQVEPSYGPAWLNHGAMLVKVKNYDKAASVLRRAVELMPNRPQAYLNYGSALRGGGKLVEALGAFKKALSMRRGYPAAYFNMGILYLDAQKPFDGKDRVQQLAAAVANFNRYKQTGAYGKDDAVNEYIDSAHKMQKREQRRREREARKKARDAQKAAEGGKKDK